MTSSKRWETAQTYEMNYWRGVAKKIAEDAEQQLTWYDWKASEVNKTLEKYKFKPDDSSNVLEIGSGPIGTTAYLGWGKRVALDPLAEFYGEFPSLVAVRNPDVEYVKGQGEKLPYPDGYFSLVIIDNVLDHVNNAEGVLDEIFRVLADDGVLYLELNIHTLWGCLLHILLAKLNIDKGHPYSFTDNKIRRFLNNHGFDVQADWQNEYLDAREKNRKSNSLKAKVKGYTGLSEFIYFSVCTKKKA